MTRPSSTAAAIVSKRSSASTIAAACLATSVPRLPIATPMSACLSAGASLMPSPIMATISPSFCSDWTTMILCSGVTRLKAAAFATTAARAAGVAFQLTAVEDGLVGADEPELAADRLAR